MRPKLPLHGVRFGLMYMVRKVDRCALARKIGDNGLADAS
jgi:hypothetical protein